MSTVALEVANGTMKPAPDAGGLHEYVTIANCARNVMDKTDYLQIVDDKINQLIEAVFPHGGGGILTEHKLRHLLDQTKQAAFSQGENYALMSLMDIDAALFAVNQQLQADDRKPISKRRLQAIARNRHDRFGVGCQVTGTNAWLFRPEEIESLVPRQYDRDV